MRSSYMVASVLSGSALVLMALAAHVPHAPSESERIDLSAIRGGYGDCPDLTYETVNQCRTWSSVASCGWTCYDCLSDCSVASGQVAGSMVATIGTIITQTCDVWGSTYENRMCGIWCTCSGALIATWPCNIRNITKVYQCVPPP